MGRTKVSRRALRWGLLVFVGLAVLGHFDPNPGGLAPVRPAAVSAAAEGGGHSLVHQAKHAAHHIPHRLPYWMRPGYGGGGGQQNAGDQRASNDAVVDGLSKLY